MTTSKILGTHGDYIFEKVGTEATEQVLAHLWAHFYPDEALSLGVNLPGSKAEGDIELFVRDILSNGKSYVAKTEKGGEVVGVMLMSLTHKGHSEDEYGVGQLSNPQLIRILRFLEEIEATGGDLFEKHNVDAVWDFVIISVDRAHRGKGLSYAIVRTGLDMIAREGGRLAKCVATCFASRKVFGRVGFQPVTEWQYNKYKVDGEIVFTNVEPEVSSTFMLKHIKKV